jgi:antitoxin component YwqK of YwqJK toxin-antitoxin module
MIKDIKSYNKEGRKHGYWETYYLNGRVLYKGYYNNGKRHDHWEVYNVDGNLSHKGTFDNDKKIGLWEWYYKGELQEQIFYS